MGVPGKNCYIKVVFGSFLCASLLRRCSVTSKPRDCVYDSYRRRNFVFPLFLNIKWTIVKIWWNKHICLCYDHCLLKEIANSLDFRGFRQIILYFELSTWTHIVYRLKKHSTLIYFCFLFFLDKQHVYLSS